MTLAALLLSTTLVQQQLPMPKLNAPAPKLAPMEVIQGKPLTKYEPGKVYVIEFWATWCHPCVAAFPHLNELVKEFKGQPIEFYSITNQSKKDVAGFLEKHPLDTNILSDTKNQTWNGFGVQVIPRTAIVDSKGQLIAITAPELLTSQVIKDLLAGKKVSVETRFNKVSSFDWDEDIQKSSLGHALIEASDSNGSGFNIPPNSGRITGDGLYPQTIVMVANKAEPNNMRWEFDPEPFLYRVSVKAPDGKDETARTMLNELAHKIFEFDAQWENVEKDVFVLTGDSLKVGPARPEDKSGMARSGEINWPNCDMNQFARLVGDFIFGKTVVNESKQTGKFSVNIKWIPGDMASALDALKKLGISVEPAKRSVPELVVRKIKKQ